ncbi:MAG: serine hydrolase domain-containing protein [Dehalococcoidia bacterium]
MTTATEIHGICQPGYERIRDAFARNFEEHGEIGAALSLVVDGEPVVDIWGGHADPARTRPWEQDTIVNTFSTTKGITTVCALRLVEQGKLDLDAPVATYWPEFAQAGKEKITVRQLMSHRAGLPAVKDIIPVEHSHSWEPLVNALAAQEPWWEPGTAHGYHAVTFGSLVGEVIRRVSGKSVGTFWREEVAEPFGIDFHIGFGSEKDSRVAEMIPAELASIDPENSFARALMNPMSVSFKAFMITPLLMVNPTYMNTREWRAAEIPAANGHGTARALARLYGALATGGELDGAPVLKPETIDMAREEQSSGEDIVLLMPTRFGTGFMLDVPEYQVTPTGALFGHPGLGGSFGFADPDARIGMGYVMNQMMFPGADLIDVRWQGMLPAIYASV